MAAREKDTLFMSGVLTVLLSQLVVKLTGLIYRLVITNIEGFGDIGNGFYTAGFQLYALLLAVSSVGIPNAISRMVSTERARGSGAEATQIYHTALVLFAGVGACCSLLLYAGADFIALRVIRMDGVQGTLRALSPSIVFVCVSSVIRGYYLGLGSVKPSSRSQMLEQVCKSVLTVVFVLQLMAYPASVMSAGANLATSTATLISFLYLVWYCRRDKQRHAQTAAPRVKLDKAF